MIGASFIQRLLLAKDTRRFAASHNKFGESSVWTTAVVAIAGILFPAKMWQKLTSSEQSGGPRTPNTDTSAPLNHRPWRPCQKNFGGTRNLWLVGSSAGSTPAGTVLLSTLFVLMAMNYVVNRLLAMPSAEGMTAKEDNRMSKFKVMLASATNTLHGLGVSGLAGCLLTKDSWRVSAI